MAFPPSRSVPDWFLYTVGITGLFAGWLTIGRYFYANRVQIAKVLRIIVPKSVLGFWLYGNLAFTSWWAISQATFELSIFVGISGAGMALCIIDMFFPKHLLIRRFIRKSNQGK